MDKIKERYNSDKKFQNDVKKAWYAYHAGHFRLHSDTHNFPTEQRESVCMWCGRSRETVRWDYAPPKCFNRPSEEQLDVEAVIAKEEENFTFLMNRAETIIPKLLKRAKLDGKLLSDLHTTYGIYPEIVEFFIDGNLDKYIMQEYDEERTKRKNSNKSFKLTKGNNYEQQNWLVGFK